MLSILFSAIAVLIILFAAGPASRFADVILSRLARLSRGGMAVWAFIAGTSLSTCLLTACLLFWPVPSVHDEFAYVLAADTFASGRLTNPSHPFHEHFASWHIIHEPSYQGKYPPAQGLALALGEWLFQHKLIGVWLSYAAGMLATYWAAVAWLPRRWALLATGLLMTNVPLAFAWGNSYWGGAVTLLGGSLLVGGWGRLRNGQCGSGQEFYGRSPWWLSGLACGLGMGILAASRPFEGALMAFPIGIDGLLSSRRLGWRPRIYFWGTAASGVVASLLGLAIFHAAVTGNPLKMPYQVWTAQQGEALNRLLTPAMVLVHGSVQDQEQFDGQDVRDAVASTFVASPRVRATSFSSDWRSGELAYWMQVRSDARLAFTWDKLLKTYAFFLQAVLCLPLIALPWLLGRQSGWRVMLIAVGLVTIGCCLHLSAGHAHYVAGITSLLSILTVACLRTLYLGLPSLGKPLLGATLMVWMLLAVVWVGAEVVAQPHQAAHAWAKRRHALQEQLAARELQDSRKQLVFVSYANDHNVHREWVYNAANIDAASVIWANDLGASRNHQLIQYYRDLCGDCDPWLLVVSKDSEMLVPYEPTALVSQNIGVEE